MLRLSARPHHVGSPYDKRTRNGFWRNFKELGSRREHRDLRCAVPHAQRSAPSNCVEPTRFVAKLEEPAVAVDPTSNQKKEQLPTYNAYSADGDVTAPLVYVNYGIPEDYEQLERLGVSVKNAIVIARYGGSWRGIKPKVAAEHGAVGCIIYSDPREDGYCRGRCVSERRVASVRGRAARKRDGYAALSGRSADARSGSDAGCQTPSDQRSQEHYDQIPVLPISYGDAQPLLAALEGPVAPAPWRGSLPITYHIGPGPAKVHLKVKFNWDIKRIYDVIVRIPGSSEPERWVIRGNHHDAWVNGAEDPRLRPAVAEMEEARGLALLVEAGLAARSALSSIAFGMARRRGCWARPSGRRRTRTSCASTLPCISIRTRTDADS